MSPQESVEYRLFKHQRTNISGRVEMLAADIDRLMTSLKGVVQLESSHSRILDELETAARRLAAVGRSVAVGNERQKIVRALKKAQAPIVERNRDNWSTLQIPKNPDIHERAKERFLHSSETLDEILHVLCVPALQVEPVFDDGDPTGQLHIKPTEPEHIVGRRPRRPRECKV